MSRTRGLVILLACLALWLARVATAVPALAPRPNGGSGDVLMYQTMLSRLRAGEEYYDVVGGELRRGHYALVPAFNWRTPLLLNALARVPAEVGRGSLILLGLLLLGATVAATAPESMPTVLASGFMQAGVIASVAVPGAVVMGEAWAGMLIGLSACLYALKRARWAVPLAMLALFIRELAAPYCVACALLATANRRWREVAAWLAGAFLYAAYYEWHLVQVSAHQLPTDLAHASSWFHPGDLPSLLAKARWQAWLLVSPPWVTAVALTVVVGGTIGARTPVHMRVTSLVYVAFFLAAGAPFNDYWGLIAWPAWALAFGFGAHLLWIAVTERSRKPESSA